MIYKDNPPDKRTFFYVKIPTFDNQKRAMSLAKPKSIKNPEYTGMERRRKKPIGGIWAYSEKMFRNLKYSSSESFPDFNPDEYMMVYMINDTFQSLSSRNMTRRYKSLKTRKYIKRISDFFYDFDYEAVASKYAYIEIYAPTLYYADSKCQKDDYYDIFITDISKFRVFGMTKESELEVYLHYKEKYYSDINRLNLTDNLKDYLKRSFGFHVCCGNFLSIEDIMFDIKTYDGKYIQEKTPNLGKVNYAKLVAELVDKFDLDEKYLIPMAPKKNKVVITIEPNNPKFDLLKKFLEENNIKYTLKGE